MKPTIGVTALFDEKKDSIWMLPGYMEGIRQAGGLPVILPLNCDDSDIDQLIRLCDGVLFTGGHDVNPALYGETMDSNCGIPCLERDAIERKLFDKAIALDLPIFGICRGLQFFNAVMGGTLYQDIPTQFAGSDSVTHQPQVPYDAPRHKVNLIAGTPLHTLLGVDKLAVNSFHHQGVKMLASGLLPAAIAEDGLIEAIYAPHKSFVHAVQWHPELMFETDEASRKLFRAFVSACASNK